MTLRSLGFWFCILLVAWETSYGFYWAIPNIGVRLGVWPHSIHPGLYDIIPTLSWWQETAFFTHVVLNTVALWALLRRWVACVPVYIAAFLLDSIDWIVMGLNPLSSARNESAGDWIAFLASFGGIGFSAMLQFIAIMIMALMLQNGQLRMSHPPELTRLIGRLKR